MILKSKIAVVLVCAATMFGGAAQAQLLGGGALGGDGGGLGLVGGSDSDALVTIGSGDAGTGGLVNVGLGGGDGQVLDTNIGNGGTGPLVDANVSLGGSNGLLDVNAGVNGVLDANINVDLGLGGNNGSDGTNGTNGINGVNGSNGINGRNGTNGAIVVINANKGGGGGTSIGSNSSACAGTNPNQLISLFQQTQLSGWNRASNIQLVPIRVCAELRRQIGNWLAANGNYQRLVGAVAADALIRAALSRTNYQPGHVLGVQRQGATLMVYVF